MHIVGWERNIPQLATFFAILKRRPNSLTPFNLFLSGKPGTNKTEGILHLAHLLDESVQLVDSSTLDDVSELAGIIDLAANRERGQARIIEGDLLKGHILVLDEFLNTRPHVVPQFRLMLQGRLVLFGKQVEMDTRAIIGTGNLSEEMEQGDANILDTPTADRFAMVVSAPSLSELSAPEMDAVLEGGGSNAFAIAFKAAVDAIDASFEQVEREYGSQATSYVRALLTQLAGTNLSFEGRRGKLLRLFVLAAIALSRAEPHRDRDETIWKVVRDCLSFHRLSGLSVDLVALETAHKIACQCMGDTSIEAQIATEPELAFKVALLVQHLGVVTPLTKADVFSRVAGSNDVPLQLACQLLVRSSEFASQPAELAAFMERIQFSAPSMPLSVEQLQELSSMDPVQAVIYQFAQGREEEMNRLAGSVAAHLTGWGIPAPQMVAA